MHTSSIGVRTKIKGTIVVFRWPGTVCRNILPNLLGEVEVVNHVLRDRAIVVDEGGRVEAHIVIRESKAFYVGREDFLVGSVSHAARGGEGLGSEVRLPMGYKSKAGGTPRSLGGGACHGG